MPWPELRPSAPVLLVVTAFSRHASALAWAEHRLEEHFGPIGLISPDFPFTQTRYYEPEMGPGLVKRLFAFERLVPAESLAAIKRATLEMEKELAFQGSYAERRPLNLDPGLLSLGKFQLATTKDQAHRIYLGQGIFAEVTLRFRAGAFHPWEWTYPSYRQPGLLDFLRVARDYYRQRLGG
ncbi:MAG: DUF4416 family protein [Gemmataceae bacterium]|nr:DUF4416 family protein [Gemmataceae bacterium]MDW8264392.1 DUF4416 family protein [Gemmataceae bacterium]